MPQELPAHRQLRTFSGLRRIVATLRGPDGCPWDRVQTHETLRPYLTEEAAEVLAAIDGSDPDTLRDELGDLLFQVLIHVQLAEERRDFTMADVIFSLASKLVRRHPHVFSSATADTPEAVVEQWDELKRRERGTVQALSGIPRSLPSLAYAQAIQRRAANAGFAWDTEAQAWEALEEELEEIREAQTPEHKREEVGDALFALANLARHLGADAEDSLRRSSDGFVRLFEAMESMIAERGIDLRGADLNTKLALWEEAKTGTGRNS
jgi:tetrapyrrole methylase family protein/MazG family protein